jgi:1-acyl-sn-glycerol-3-phosphate acyltransferase
MTQQEALAQHAKRNGAGEGSGEDGKRDLRPGLSSLGAVGRLGTGVARFGQAAAEGVGGAVARRMRRSLTADLDDRDPDYIRENLPLLWLFASLWFRGEVRGLGNVPERGPVLLVGNHSGGNVPADTLLFTLAFSTYFGVERRFHQLAHNLVLALPTGRMLRPYGTVPASHQHAERALDAGAAVLVYPGGDWEVHRPIWERNKVDFAGRKGFIQLALDKGVPIVPVVAIGGQETALFLSRGNRIASALGVDRLLRLKVMPISIAIPWGLNVGDFLGHVPLPSKLTIEVLPPIELEAEFGGDPDVDEVYDHVVALMQEALDTLVAERRLPVIG